MLQGGGWPHAVGVMSDRRVEKGDEGEKRAERCHDGGRGAPGEAEEKAESRGKWPHGIASCVRKRFHRVAGLGCGRRGQGVSAQRAPQQGVYAGGWA